MKGNTHAVIKCPFCGQKIQVKSYTAHIKSKNGDPVRKEMGVVTWWKAFKGRYCPKIDCYNLDSQYKRNRSDNGFGWGSKQDEMFDDDHYDNHNSEHEV